MNLETGEQTTITDRFGEERYGAVNDLALDNSGRIYFTENDYMGPEEIPDPHPPGVYRVDPDGRVHRIIRDAGAPNGIMVSPDQRTLYVGMNRYDSLGNGAVLAYDLAENGDVEFRSILAVQKPEDQQLADGMAIDVDGNLFVALFSDEARTGIAVFSPDGEQLAFIPTPGPATNVTFGLGSDATSLYITAGGSLYRFPVKRWGYHPTWRSPR
jgi:gluconolactonase